MSYFDKDRTTNAGNLGWAKRGLSSVGEYQASGRPWVKTFTLPDPGNDGDATSEYFADSNIIDDDDAVIEFPFLAKSIQLKNDSGNNVQVYFCSLRVPSELGSDGAGADIDATGVAVDVISRGDKVTDAELNAYFTGVTDNRPTSAVKENGTYWIIPDGESVKIDVKCKRVYVTGVGASPVSLFAELTNIDNQYNCDYRGIVGISDGTAGTSLS